MEPLELNFSFGSIDPLWIDGKCPISHGGGRKVKVTLSGVANSTFPPIFLIGELLCSERPSPVQHAITLLLEYAHSITPSPAVKKDGWWTVPGSPVIGQIRIPLPTEAIAQIRAKEDNTDEYDYQLALANVKLVNVSRSR
jgi:hypothetical protein